MQKSITELKNKHAGCDIWVLASGASMNFIDNSFFENKITIAINRTGNYFDCTYTVTKDFGGLELLKKSPYKSQIIMSKHSCGNPRSCLNKLDMEHYIFEHKENPHTPTQTQLDDEISKSHDRLIVSHSTTTSALHCAAYMGAKNIIICGHDGGSIDGKLTIDGYYKDIQPHQDNEAGYLKWVGATESHSIVVCKKIKEIYGCNIHSLNPFINLGLCGHIYSK